MEKNSAQDQKSDRPEIDHVEFAGNRTGHQYISVQEWKQIATSVEKMTLRKGM